MTFARPRRNIRNDQRYAFTALARGGWDGRWDDRSQGYRNAPGFGDGGGGRSRGRRKGRQADSRFDPRYDYHYDDAGGGVPLPSFAPLPDYAGGGDDMSSVGGDGGSVSGSVYTTGSQQWSRGGYYSHDMRSQADSASVASSRY